MLGDALLVEQALDGMLSAFGQLALRYQAAAFALANQYVHNTHDAQDIVQEAFCSTYLHLPKLRDRSHFQQGN